MVWVDVLWWEIEERWRNVGDVGDNFKKNVGSGCGRDGCGDFGVGLCIVLGLVVFLFCGGEVGNSYELRK